MGVWINILLFFVMNSIKVDFSKKKKKTPLLEAYASSPLTEHLLTAHNSRLLPQYASPYFGNRTRCTYSPYQNNLVTHHHKQLNRFTALTELNYDKGTIIVVLSLPHAGRSSMQPLLYDEADYATCDYPYCVDSSTVEVCCRTNTPYRLNLPVMRVLRGAETKYTEATSGWAAPSRLSTKKAG